MSRARRGPMAAIEYSWGLALRWVPYSGDDARAVVKVAGQIDIADAEAEANCSYDCRRGNTTDLLEKRARLLEILQYDGVYS